ncbi:uncharacterized protein EAF02_011676 [Botrytis sinoallii]|uniref:uncharacterized protein n=1 Tax=Botrytis sinoallii TaxID=1463999 RepID=UPI0019022553|nr:uncharacterized protein EAF02_011676 [Botrytis sinoallii]KAF7854501.1 hypothetical protein EAF02_011676 [Botrytis sinoallii]
MRLRSGLDKSSERDSRGQPAQAAIVGMEEHHFTDSGSTGADVGSSSGSPSEPDTQNCDTSNRQQAQGTIFSIQHEEYQEIPMASSHYAQRPCSAPPSFYDPTLYPEPSIPVLYPTTSASYLQPSTTTTASQLQPQLQLQHHYPPYMPSHINAPQPESIYTSAPSYPHPPPPPAPTPPPPPPHSRHFDPSQHYPQAHLPYHQAQNQYHTPLTQPQPQTPHLPSIRPNFSPLPTSQTQLQTHQPHYQSQESPWSPLSAHESRKRRASDALSSAGLGVADADVDWGYKDKMGRELDSLEMESRSMRRRDERGEGSERGNVPGSSRRSRRRLNDEDVGNGSSGRRQRGRDEDEDEDENEVGYEARMARGEGDESDRGNGHAYS